MISNTKPEQNTDQSSPEPIQKANNRTIAKNVTVTYIRSIVAAGFALLSSRWILSALGQEDFGLYAVISSALVFVTFLNGILSGGVARFYAFNSKEDVETINWWFNTALSIHLCVAISLVITGFIFGNIITEDFLNIPENRRHASLIIFRITLFGAFINMASVPYIAMFTAKQRFTTLAFWGITQSFLIFISAFCLSYVKTDRLIAYSAIMSSIIVTILIAQIISAHRLFPECRIKLNKWWNTKMILSILQYSAWNIFGGLGSLFRNHGSAILLNLKFGPVINSSYGVANQVANQTDQLTNALNSSMAPEIIASEGRKDKERVISLSIISSKMGSIFVMLFGAPIIILTDEILNLWLISPPPFASNFCQVILIAYIIDRMTAGQMIAINATGKIALYQLTVGTLLMLTLPTAWLLVNITNTPVSVSYAYLAIIILSMIGRVYWGRKICGIPVTRWAKGALIPCVTVFLSGAVSGMIAKMIISSNNFITIPLVVTITITAMILTFWLFFMSSNEKAIILEKFRRITKVAQK